MNPKQFVLVGGSRGIGKGMVKRLLDQGDSVTVLSRTPPEIEGRGRLIHVPFDVLQNDCDSGWLPDVVDGFAYCPGSITLRSFRSLRMEDFRNDLEINLLGAIRTMQAVLPALKKAESSSVLFFSTVAVSQGMPMHASIAAAKGAIEGLARSLAAELSPSIRVNCIAPALTDTPLAARFFSDPEKIAAMGAKYPLGRTGTVDDIAALAVFLLSGESHWITGQVLGVDGGMSQIRK